MNLTQFIRQTMPPDPDGINDDRSAWAGNAIRAFQAATGTDDEDGRSTYGPLHWSDRNNCDFEAALCRAPFHVLIFSRSQ
jgi:hypothetical protein